MGELDLFFIEVDGTLANPFVVTGVVAWSALLSASVAWLAYRHLAAAASALALGALVTPAAQHVLARLTYFIADPSIDSVGFWGAPPRWIAPALAGAGGVLVWLWSVRRRRTGPPPA